MVYINHTLALLGFLTTPVILLVSLRLGRLVKKYSVHVQDLNAETVALATDILTNVRTVQSFGREAAEQQNYVERSTATFNTRRRVVFMMSGTNMLVAQLKSTANLLVLLFAAWLVLVKHPEGGPGPLTVGLLVTFRMYLNTALSNISGLSSAYVAIQQAPEVRNEWPPYNHPPLELACACGTRMCIPCIRIYAYTCACTYA